jgi:hypothetical protein
MSNKGVWHKGPPPHAGWWEASVSRNRNVWRWWDGKRWSDAVSDLPSAKTAAFTADFPTTLSGIEWTDYYPANARVPRIDPSNPPIGTRVKILEEWLGFEMGTRKNKTVGRVGHITILGDAQACVRYHAHRSWWYRMESLEILPGEADDVFRVPRIDPRNAK